LNVLTVSYNGQLKEREFSVYRKDAPHFNVTEIVLLHNNMARELGKARILRITRVSLWDKSNYNVPKITKNEAQAAGFKNLGHMRHFFGDNLEPLYKITVRREE